MSVWLCCWVALICALGRGQLSTDGGDIADADWFALTEVVLELTGVALQRSELKQCAIRSFVPRVTMSVKCERPGGRTLGIATNPLRVVELSIGRARAGATLSPAVATLKHLRELRINTLSGTGPVLVGGALPDLGALTGLTRLEIPHNELHGRQPVLPPSLTVCELAAPYSDPSLCCPLDAEWLCARNPTYSPPFKMSCLPGADCLTGSLLGSVRSAVRSLPLRNRQFKGVATANLAVEQPSLESKTQPVRACLSNVYENPVTLTTSADFDFELTFEVEDVTGTQDPRLRLASGIQLKPFVVLPFDRTRAVGFVELDKALIVTHADSSFVGVGNDCIRLEIDDDTGTLHMWLMTSIVTQRGCLFDTPPPRAPICVENDGAELLDVEQRSGVRLATDAWIYVRLDPVVGATGEPASPQSRSTVDVASDAPFVATTDAPSSSNVVAIVGGAVGGVVVLCIVGAAIFFLCVLRGGRSGPTPPWEASARNSPATDRTTTASQASRQKQLEAAGYDVVTVAPQNLY